MITYETLLWFPRSCVGTHTGASGEHVCIPTQERGNEEFVGGISDSASTMIKAQWWMRAVIVPYNLTALTPSMEDAKRRLIPPTSPTPAETQTID